MYEGQGAYGLGQPHQHVQLHCPEVLGRLQVQTQFCDLIQSISAKFDWLN